MRDERKEQLIKAELRKSFEWPINGDCDSCQRVFEHSDGCNKDCFWVASEDTINKLANKILDIVYPEK